MFFLRLMLTMFLLFLLLSCSKPEKKGKQENQLAPVEKVISGDTAVQDADTAATTGNQEMYATVSDTGFVVLNQYASGFAYEMKYATDDNFMKKAVYACDACLLRKEVADALKEANASLQSRGFRIKFYDCYRPLDVQKQMWEIYPKPGYVANPKTGSIHNRGGAVDITLVDAEGQELDMGTGFDHFGKEAHHSYSELPDTVLSNRKLLKEMMEAHGFSSIRTEWWHYNFRAAKSYPLSNFSVECE